MRAGLLIVFIGSIVVVVDWNIYQRTSNHVKAGCKAEMSDKQLLTLSRVSSACD